MEDDTRCAPSKKYEKGSCFTLESLKVIANKYNETNKDKIIISNNKKDLVDQLEEKLSKNCSSQTCWLSTDLIQEIDNDEIKNNTFRPQGPKSKYGWLSTTNINEVIDQYHTNHKDFSYLGTVPYDFQEIYDFGFHNFNFDELYNEGKYKIGMVINLDESHQDGSHWVGLYADLKKNQIYFFDSVGKPPRRKIKKFINKITDFMYKKKYNSNIKIGSIMELINNLTYKSLKNKYFINLKNKLSDFDIRYNHVQHQFKNSECGVYSINFIIRLVKGEKFDNIINNIIKDDKMNECRQVYFHNA
jgi:hypothetical protein